MSRTRAVSSQPDVGSAPTDPPPPGGAEGTIIASKYRVLGQIGAGGMGVVYEAEHVHTHRRVALKVLLEERTRPTDAARFMREGRAASQIGHPGIVEVLDAGYHRGQPYVALELLTGKTFEDALEDGDLTLRDLRDVMLQVLDALHAAHEAGIVHRDIKPENIFLCEGDGGPRAKLLDFGIAKTVEGVDTKLTVTGTVMGTPAYMSPEQAKGEVVDRRADLWSVAAMLFRAVAGDPPFVADNYNVLIAQILTQDPPSIRELHPSLPSPFADVIERGLVRRPSARIASAAAMAELLGDDSGIETWGDAPCTDPDLPAPVRRSLSDRPPARHASGEVTVLQKPTTTGGREAPRSTPFVWIAVVMAALGVAGLAVALMQEPDAPPEVTPPIAATADPEPEVVAPVVEPATPDEPTPARVTAEAPEPEPPAPEATEPEVVEPEPAAAAQARPRPARRGRTEPSTPTTTPPPRGFVIEREYE